MTNESHGLGGKICSLLARRSYKASFKQASNVLSNTRVHFCQAEDYLTAKNVHDNVPSKVIKYL